MAKPVRASAPKVGHIKEAVRDIERLKAERVTEHSRYMARCSKINSSIAEVKDTAKERGIAKKELNTLLKRRDLVRKYSELRADLEADERSTLDVLEGALGDFSSTDLGKAALAAESNGKDKRTDQQRALEQLTQA